MTLTEQNQSKLPGQLVDGRGVLYMCNHGHWQMHAYFEWSLQRSGVIVLFRRRNSMGFCVLLTLFHCVAL